MDMVDAANYFKANCPKCGVNIEVPFELYDSMVECPDCKNEIVALPIAAKPTGNAPKVVIPQGFSPRNLFKPKFSKQFIIAICAVTGISIILAVWFLYIKFGEKLMIWTGSAVAGIVIIIVVVFVFLWWLLWVLFPVFVFFGMERMEKILRQIERNTRRH